MNPEWKAWTVSQNKTFLFEDDYLRSFVMETEAD